MDSVSGGDRHGHEAKTSKGLDHKDQLWHTCHARWWSSPSAGFPTPTSLDGPPPGFRLLDYDLSGSRTRNSGNGMDAVQMLTRHKLVCPPIVHTAYADTRSHALGPAGKRGRGNRLAELLCKARTSPPALKVEIELAAAAFIVAALI
jgi:hypothetical protein